MGYKNNLSFFFFGDSRTFDIVIAGKTKEEVKAVDVQQIINSLGREHNLESGEVVVESVIEKDGRYEDSDDYFGSFVAEKTHIA